MSEAIEQRDLEVVQSTGPLTVSQVVGQALLVQQIMEAVMKEGTHYGVIPGTQKPTLYKPGAEKLTTTFRLAPSYRVEDLSAPDGSYYRFRARCQLHTIGNQTFVGEGFGSASSDEEKFCWQKAVCDEQFEETDPAFKRKKYQLDQNEPGGYRVIKQVKFNMADKENTILKMSMKRALIHVTIQATAAGDMFAQDLEDLEEELNPGGAAVKKETKEHKPKPRPSPLMPYGPAKGKAITDPMVDTHLLESMLQSIQVKLAKPGHDPKWDAQDKTFIGALAAEIAFRKTQEQPLEQPQSPQEPSKAPSKKAKDPEPESALTDSFWADLILSLEEDMPDIYKQAKAHFTVQSGHDLPKAQRQAFYDHVGMLMEQAKK